MRSLSGAASDHRSACVRPHGPRLRSRRHDSLRPARNRDVKRLPRAAAAGPGLFAFVQGREDPRRTTALQHGRAQLPIGRRGPLPDPTRAGPIPARAPELRHREGGSHLSQRAGASLRLRAHRLRQRTPVTSSRPVVRPDPPCRTPFWQAAPPTGLNVVQVSRMITANWNLPPGMDTGSLRGGSLAASTGRTQPRPGTRRCREAPRSCVASSSGCSWWWPACPIG